MKERAVVSTLAFVLIAASGMNALAQDRPQPAASCVAGPTTLCLNDQRFKLDVQWKDFQGNTGVGQAVSLTSDTGYFWFFSSSNVELVVKVLDGRGLNGHFWVFFGALSNVEYTLRVTDSVTGSVKTYFNPSGRFASVGDTQAFSASGTVNSAYVETSESAEFASPLHFPAEANAVAQALSTCVGTETSLCLNGGRFRVEVNWKDFDGNTGVGTAISLTSDTGYFWFFNSANVELVVKVLDARGLSSGFWVFYGALSNVEYEMTVTDTLTGNVKTYSNPAGRFASTGDTGAFRAGYGVTARLDQSRAVSADVATTGGTISATASDGTLFTLNIPKDALLSQTTITMTPVTAIDGLPLSGGLAAAVDLAPTGLRLFQLATLTIAPPAAIPLAEEMTFAWRGNGEEFFLYPPALGTPAISMKLMHFSGYGVGRGSAGDQAAQQQRIPASPEDALMQRLQQLVWNKRRAQSKGLGAFADDFPIDVEAVLLDYYNKELRDQLEIARKNCEKAKAILPRAFGWARQAALFVCCPDEIQNVTNAAIDALVNCYDEAFDKCVNKNDPAQVTQMLGILRQLRLFGADDRVDQNKMERCVRFELHFESAIQTDPALFSYRVRATVPIRLPSSNIFGPLTGSAPLESFKVDYIGPSLAPCTITISSGSGVFEVANLIIDFNVYEGSGPPPEPVIMVYNPGKPDFTGTESCPEGGSVTIKGLPWFFVYSANHMDEFRGGGDSFTARGWGRVGGAVYARKTYQNPGAPGAAETTLMDLKHTPQ